MATKRVKQPAAAATPAQTAQQVWLAGLGAMSIAQKRGGQVFEGLIREGKSVQDRTGKMTREISRDMKAQLLGALTPIKVRIKADGAKLGDAVQGGVAVVLAKLGIPSKADIAELTTRVTALSRQLKTR